MWTVLDVAVIAAGLLFASVVGLLIYVAIKRAVKRAFMHKLERRIRDIEEILDRAATDDFRKVDRLLFQLSQVKEKEAVRIALQDKLGSLDQVPDGLSRVYAGLGLIDHYLENLAHGKRWEARVAAARSLGRLGTVEAIPALVSRMRDPHEDARTVKQAAAEALGRMQAVEAIPSLLEELSQPDDWASPRLAEALLGFGETAVPALIDSLGNEESTNARVWAAQILGRLKVGRSSVALIERLRDRSEQVRISVTEALGQLADRRAIPDLTQMALKDPVPTVRAEAARALGMIGDVSVIDELLLLLSSSDYWTRLRAVEAIEKLKPEDTFPLEQALLDDSKVVRGEAARALQRLGVLDHRIESLSDEEEAVWEPVKASLVQFGRAGSMDTLLKCVRSEQAIVRERICHVLAEIGDAYALPGLFQLLEDNNPDVRAAAVKAIGSLHPEDAAERLAPSLEDPRERVRFAAIEAFHSIDPARLALNVEQLAELFEHGEPEARSSVVAAVQNAPGEAVEALLRAALGDPHPDVRLRAAREVGDRPAEAWVRPLTDLLADVDPRVRKAAARSLGGIASDAAIEALAESLATPDREFREILTDLISRLPVEKIRSLIGDSSVQEKRLAMAWALGKTGDPSVMPHLEVLSNDRSAEVRAATAGALAKVEEPESIGILETLLSDPNERVRSAAINALVHLNSEVSLPMLIAMIDEPNQFTARRLMLALGQLGGAAAETALLELQKRWRDCDAEAYLAVSFGLLGSPSGRQRALDSLRVDALVERLQDTLARESEALGLQFRAALGIDEESPMEAIDRKRLSIFYREQLLNDPLPTVREDALSSLETLGIDDKYDLFLRVATGDPAPEVRRRAVQVLAGHVQEIPVAGTLERVLRDPVVEVQRAAVQALGGARDIVHNAALLHLGAVAGNELRADLVDALREANAGRLPEWLASLGDLNDPKEQALGASVLGAIGDVRAEELLLRWVDRRELVLRSAAIGALGRISTARAREALSRCLEDPREEIRRETIRALLGHPVADVAEALTLASCDPSEAVRTTLAHRLAGSSGAASIGLARALAEDPAEAVRGAALESLLAIDEAGALEAFLEVYASQPDLVQRRLRSQADDSPSMQALQSRILEDPSAGSRRLAIRVLEALDKRPVELFLQAFRDPVAAVRLAAVEASQGSNDAELAVARESLLQDPDQAVRDAVRRGSLRVLRGPGFTS